MRKRTLVLLALISIVGLAVVLFTLVLTIDLGPYARRAAEEQGSKIFSGRPLHIGKLVIHPASNSIIVENLWVESPPGPTAPPFFSARRIEVGIPFANLFHRQLLLESIRIIDWRMAINQYPGGRHDFPKLNFGKPRVPGARPLISTKLQMVTAENGEFTYTDHGAPWQAIASHINFRLAKYDVYRGTLGFRGGKISIKDYVPMTDDMDARLHIDNGTVFLDRVEVRSDGARSEAEGTVSLSHWPDFRLTVGSDVDFATMREIFFGKHDFTLTGRGRFDGAFNIRKSFVELAGTYKSPLVEFDGFRCADLTGTLRWIPSRFEVPHARTRLYGGVADLGFSIAPIGLRGRPAQARFEARYAGVRLAEFSDAVSLHGMRFDGTASGRNLLVWPLDDWPAHHGDGVLTVADPVGRPTLGPPPEGGLLEPGLAPFPAAEPAEPAPPEVHPLSAHLAVAGGVVYRFDESRIHVSRGWASTSATQITFSGSTAYGQRSQIDFTTRSRDLAESDRVLAHVLTAVGERMRPIDLSGRGAFDGTFTGSLSRPTIDGEFRGDEVRYRLVTWGHVDGHVRIDNGYASFQHAVITIPGSLVRVNGKFSFSAPRRDGGDEVDVTVHAEHRPLRDFLRGFEYDFPILGDASADVKLFGRYRAPLGYGTVEVRTGSAWGETADRLATTVRLDGKGVTFQQINGSKAGGTLTGAANVTWAGAYAFELDARRLPIESFRTVAIPAVPLSGLLSFSGSGAGTFWQPRFDLRANVNTLFVKDEGIGRVSGTVSVRGKNLALDLEAASPRLAISGAGSIGLTRGVPADLTFTFTRTSLDPYARAFVSNLSPFTTAIASGTLRVNGELTDVDRLVMDGSIGTFELRLFDYAVSNQGPLRLTLDRHTLRLVQVRLVGEGTQLDLSGTVGLHDRRIDLRTDGSADLRVLQGFARDVRASGRAEVAGEIRGPLSAPAFGGGAVIYDGRFRFVGTFPHSLEAINGRLGFDPAGVRFEDMTARLGGGPVRLGGHIGIHGYSIGALDILALGQDMRLRYPEDMRSVVNADLSLRGDARTPTLAGTVNVASAVWNRRFDPTGGLFDFGKSAGPSVPSEARGPLAATRFDIRIVVPSTLRIENNLAKIVASADLTLRGTYDRPVLVGRAEIERGEVFFEGNRYRVTRGTIDFANPVRLDPFFDVEAETRVRMPGQTYRILFHAAGTASRFVPELSSDPPLPTVEILSVLLGGVRGRPEELELQAVRGGASERLLETRVPTLLASPVAGEIGRMAEQIFGVDRFEITPTLIDPSSSANAINPTARLTIGKRISNRVYLTLARSLSQGTPDQGTLLLLEYEQGDRVSWIVSQNEDRTYAIEFRVRRTF